MQHPADFASEQRFSAGPRSQMNFAGRTRAIAIGKVHDWNRRLAKGIVKRVLHNSRNRIDLIVSSKAVADGLRIRKITANEFLVDDRLRQSRRVVECYKAETRKLRNADRAEVIGRDEI